MLCTSDKARYVAFRINIGYEFHTGCEAAMYARTRCELAKFRECGQLLY